MNVPTVATVSCKVFPGRRGVKFTDDNAKSPVIFKAAPALFRFSLWRTDSELYDVGNLSTVKLSVHAQPFAGLSVEQSTSAFTTALTSADWDAGARQHFSISFTAADTSGLTAGNYDCTLWDAATTDVLGICLLTVLDVGMTVTTPTGPPGVVYVTSDQLAASLSTCIRRGINPAGVWFALTSPDGAHQIQWGVGNDGLPSYNLTPA